MKMKNEFNIATWNILFDTNPKSKVLPQSERSIEFAKIFNKLKKRFDVVSICEAEDAEMHENHGAKIAELSGYKSGSWTHHSRPHENIGMFGDMVEKVEFVEIGGNRTAAISKVDGVVIVGVHLTYSIRGNKIRTKQIDRLIKHLAGYEKVIIMGDFNCITWQKPRKRIEIDGFNSVFDVLDMQRPTTAPIREYKKYLKAWQRLIVVKGFSADDIYVKNISVKEVGTLKGPSDHLGLWATLEA